MIWDVIVAGSAIRSFSFGFSEVSSGVGDFGARPAAGGSQPGPPCLTPAKLGFAAMLPAPWDESVLVDVLADALGLRPERKELLRRHVSALPLLR